MRFRAVGDRSRRGSGKKYKKCHGAAVPVGSGAGKSTPASRMARSIPSEFVLGIRCLWPRWGCSGTALTWKKRSSKIRPATDFSEEHLNGHHHLAVTDLVADPAEGIGVR